MKKFILLTLGLAVVAASAIVISDASKYRPHSARLAPFQYHEMLKFQYRRPSASNITVKKSTVGCRNCFNEVTQHATVWNDFTDTQDDSFNKQQYQVYRSMRPNLFPRHANTVTADVFVVRTAKRLDYRNPMHSIEETIAAKQQDANLFDEPAYSLRLPTSFVRSTDGVYTNTRTGMSLDAHPTAMACNALTFEDCALKLGNSLREGYRFSATHRISQNYGLRRTTMDGARVYYPTMFETYEVNDYGIEKLYFVYTLQNPEDGTLSYVEGTAPLGNQTAVQNLMKSIARTYTFQF